jgi:hypothetical protein
MLAFAIARRWPDVFSHKADIQVAPGNVRFRG